MLHTELSSVDAATGLNFCVHETWHAGHEVEGRVVVDVVVRDGAVLFGAQFFTVKNKSTTKEEFLPCPLSLE